MLKSTKILLFVISLVATCSVSATTYYVSPTGTSSAAGTISAPLSFSTAVSKSLVAGDSLIFRGGTYSFSSSQSFSKTGSAGNLIHYVAYNSEIPVFDFRTQSYSSSSRGLNLSGNYIHVKGIIVQGAGDNGFYVSGSNNVIEKCTARWNCDSGFQFKVGSNNLILNCDSYENFDYESSTIGGNADGFADKQYENTGTNTYKGCRSWRNSDDGWDSYEKIGNTVYDSCWCYNMAPASYDMTNNIRYATDKTYIDGFANRIIPNAGNGNGFKLGGNYTANNATLNNCVSVNNLVKGFDQNNNNGVMTLYNCTSYGNQYNYGFTNNSYGTLIIKNSASLSSAKSNSFNCKSVTQDHNTWNTGFSCSTSDFESLAVAQMLFDRQEDGSLPEISLLHLVSTSVMIDKGTDVGKTYYGTAPDLGAFEYSPTTAVETVLSNVNLSVYPNPVNEKAILKFEASSAEKLSLRLFDLTGKLIVNYDVPVTMGNNEVEINTAFLDKGNYICNVKGKKVNFTCKLVK